MCDTSIGIIWAAHVLPHKISNGGRVIDRVGNCKGMVNNQMPQASAHHSNIDMHSYIFHHYGLQV